MPTDPRVRRAVTYMQSQLEHPLTVADLADQARLSPFHFLRLFKRDVGRTPHRHLTVLRIDRASDLLRQGLTVAAVAERCGFSSTAHFSAVFLRETGSRPSHWRGVSPPPVSG